MKSPAFARPPAKRKRSREAVEADLKCIRVGDDSRRKRVCIADVPLSDCNASGVVIPVEYSEVDMKGVPSTSLDDESVSESEESSDEESLCIVVKWAAVGESKLKVTSVTPDSTVRELKERICDEMAKLDEVRQNEVDIVPVERQRLIYQGRMLTREDDKLGKDAKMKTGASCFVHLAPIPEGKSMSKRSSSENQMSKKSIEPQTSPLAASSSVAGSGRVRVTRRRVSGRRPAAPTAGEPAVVSSLPARPTVADIANAVSSRLSEESCDVPSEEAFTATQAVPVRSIPHSAFQLAPVQGRSVPQMSLAHVNAGVVCNASELRRCPRPMGVAGEILVQCPEAAIPTVMPIRSNVYETMHAREASIPASALRGGMSWDRHGHTEFVRPISSHLDLSADRVSALQFHPGFPSRPQVRPLRPRALINEGQYIQLARPQRRLEVDAALPGQGIDPYGVAVPVHELPVHELPVHDRQGVMDAGNGNGRIAQVYRLGFY